MSFDRSDGTYYFLCPIMIVIPYEKERNVLMMAVCVKCKEKYEISSAMEYLLKMGLVPESQRFCCEWCR